MKKTIELKGVDLQQLLGVADAHLRILEENYPVSIVARGNEVHLEGDKEDVDLLREIFHEMIQTMNRRGSLSPEDVQQLIQVVSIDNGHQVDSPETVIHYGRKGAISSRTDGQEAYVNAVRNNDIAIAVGPAGTGKTFMAVAFAVAALENHEVDRIILCRPAVEAGENLGFLPGDLKEKVDPYLTPLYDALGEMVPQSRLRPLLERKVIEVIPLAYMRGRTLNSAFLILDEAQNATAMQMKMFLTRLGVNSRAIITGDITQIDLPQKSHSGLVHVFNILRHIKGIGFVELTESDVVRHHLVREIIKAYDEDANNHKSDSGK